MRIFKLIFKNALRHKLRTFLTILGMAIAVMAFGVLRTVVDMYYEGLEATAANRLITRQAVSYIFPLPYSYRDQIAKIPGVETVSFANWFGGTYIDKKNFFARMGVDAETIFDVYPECQIAPKEYEAFKNERNACVVGSEIAKQYGFKIGDIVHIDGDIYPGNWEFVVRGIYTPRDKSTDATQMFFHWAAIDERMKQEMPSRAGQVGWYIIKIKDPAQAAAISEQIDALFQNSSNATKTETERAFTQGFIAGFSSLLNAMNFVAYIIIGIIMLILGNTMIMSARERTREYAVLKTLGFTGGHLFGLIFGESMFISGLGAAVGLLVTYPVVSGIDALMPKGFFPYFFITPFTVILAIIAALTVGVAASVFPVQRALRTKIVDGLRFIG
ncbi:MAG TPA: FtsX-like permease family protein [Bacteroidota bacterium]|nr:FtsX-like permease family protein [Bacteroidota bacterium]